MPAPDDQRVRAFLALSLEHWGVGAALEAIDPPGVARIRLPDGRDEIVLERGGSGEPFRWYLRQRRVDDSETVEASSRVRPCGSLVGVLSALRRLLGMEAGGTARVVAGGR